MPLYLVQHGKNLSKDQDPDKGLSPVGTQESEQIAQVAGRYRVHVKRIVHSGKARALQTAEIFARELQPAQGVHARDGLTPLDDVEVYARRIESHDDHMIVGHLPFLSRLASYLVVGDADTPIFQFQNSGILCLDRQAPDSRKWVILWSLTPRIGESVSQ